MIAHKKVNVIVDRALKVNAKVSEKIVGYGDGNLIPPNFIGTYIC